MRVCVCARVCACVSEKERLRREREREKHIERGREREREREGILNDGKVVLNKGRNIKGEEKREERVVLGCILISSLVSDCPPG